MDSGYPILSLSRAETHVLLPWTSQYRLHKGFDVVLSQKPGNQFSSGESLSGDMLVGSLTVLGLVLVVGS